MVLAGKPSVRCSCFSGSYLIQIFLKTQGCQQETRKKINQKEWGCPGSSRSSAFCMPKMFFFSFIKSRGRLPTSCQHPPFCACSLLLWVCVCVCISVVIVGGRRSLLDVKSLSTVVISCLLISIKKKVSIKQRRVEATNCWRLCCCLLQYLLTSN